MPLSELIASLPIHPSKATFVRRLMRILTLSGIFSQQNDDELPEEERYVLTNASRILLKDHPFCMTPFFHVILDPKLLKPWYQLSNWFKKCDTNISPFETEHGMPFWEFITIHDPKIGNGFQDAMTSDSGVVSSVLVDKFKGVFEGVESLVDVGGGNGTMAKTIAKSFPQMECIVFDLPEVVAGLQGNSENMKYVGGDMFEAIPAADALLMKCILHDWDDEECVKLLKKCKEAITNKGKKGKVIIIDIVVGNENGDKGSLELQLLFDMEMKVLVNGKERNEKEWANLFFSSGFNNYKIIPIMMSSRSLIEVYP
ncbi:hypothetical protein PIB30_021206 [Stylosanthes scabra]|uniref:Uncharacterized protein n=1 Tax=Stylosanthes scabra TaxID=79078 RepID=A0ABU6UBJ3_9FABA|nr:hypothetical protein [Stylosanthes scabra]